MSKAQKQTKSTNQGFTMKRWVILGVGTCLLAGGAFFIHSYWQPEQVVAQPPAKPEATNPGVPAKPAVPKFVARVNNQRIPREELGRECLKRHGKEVLETLSNRFLIETHCKQHNITVTDKEIHAEIESVAKRFGVPLDHYLSMLQEERGISPQKYAEEIIWPTLALRKLAKTQLSVSDEELHKAYESIYGPKVQVRMIFSNRQEDAQKVYQEALAKPEDFRRLAMKHSTDKESASAGGLVQPIRKHAGHPVIEQTAFSLQPGQISQPVNVHQQFIILKCEQHYPASQIAFAAVKPRLEEQLRDQKLSKAAHEVFKDIQEKSKIVNIWNSQNPQLQQQYPGVAALVNNNPITIEQLAEGCIERHGEKVLEALISRKLLEQECQKRQIQVSPQEVDQEIIQTAKDVGETVENWLAKIQKDQEVTIDFYRTEVVWPTVALRKIVSADVQVSQEDLQKAFEANYQERVRLRAIFFQNQRKAREVWGMLSRDITEENFARMAEQYSVDPNSRGLGGEVPPLHRHCSNPILEREAFRLKPGEMSPVIQIGERHVILYCQGYTQPVQVTMEEVHEDMHKNIYDRKLRVAMAEAFENIKESATIDNILTGTIHEPKKKAAPKISNIPTAGAKR